jgi:beta-glucosidase
MPPFQAAVEAGVLSAMCSYNRITTPSTGETSYSCQHHESLTVDLKGRLGFEGWVMSDWTGTKSTVQAAMAGLDQEMPAGFFFGEALKHAVNSGEVDEAIINDKVLRVLSAMITIGLFDNSTKFGDITQNVTNDEHRELCAELSAAATVLAKNDGQALPLVLDGPKAVKSILIVGDAAHDVPITGGAGSGQVVPSRVVTPLEGVQARAADAAAVSYLPTPALDDDDAAAVLSAAAAVADAVLVFVGITSGEGSDRDTLALAAEDDAMVALVTAAQPTVSAVVVACPGAVLTPWADDVDALLYNFMPGQEVGRAIASVLFGDVNPSARLPVTMPTTDNEVEFTTEQYPGMGLILTANYTENLLIGYRWYDANGVEPQVYTFIEPVGDANWTHPCVLLPRPSTPLSS